mmetsp:Transcript_16576/g.37450  ORF Transcript_16576/g.37450 Transcript_16576/m.37450 type:complete len:259 (-) Transcript_16576:186-962(-)
MAPAAAASPLWPVAALFQSPATVEEEEVDEAEELEAEDNVCVTATAQVENLLAGGFVVRNTFIDAPNPWQEGAMQRRTHSAPPAPEPAGRLAARESRAAIAGTDLSPITSEWSRSSSSAKSRQDSPSPSRQSTAASSAFSERGGGAAGDADFMEACLDSARQVSELVERECAFLRIRGHGLHAKSSANAKRSDLAVTLRFYVSGLPWAKRSKWLLPLLWSVAAVLQRNGCGARVQGGRLCVPLETGAAVRIDFAAARG